MPTTAKDSERIVFFSNLTETVINTYIDGLGKGKGMFLMFIKQEIITPSGLVARPAMTSYYKSSHFKKISSSYTSPYETIMCLDSKQSMYCQLLCSLIRGDEVVYIGIAFASVFFRAIKFLEEHWQEMCYSIRTRNVSDWITDKSCQSAVMNIIRGPNSKLANLIELLFHVKSWKGVIKRLWPGAKYVYAILTGSMAQYISTVDFYYSGLPLVLTGYASSEC
ncbi:hypothetical protein GIB67_005831 [Kingdonia uniflora]|uniref:Uncharacterized protein n=1 Tax=Kingdonia uniflora TaxID=39325 RepID=A0A7J7LU58_9MAGN|nr:hypothetical protein GIB67_005831 [Kingdonia uniflora]